MPKYQYGCSKVRVGTMNPTTGVIVTPKEVEVYNETIQHEEGTPTATKHFKQGDSNAKVVRYANADETITFQVMDMSADSKVEWMGGTATTVDGKKTWHKAKGKKQPKKKALEFELEDGSLIYVPQASCIATFNNTFNDTDIATMTVVAEVLSTGLPDVADFQWTDAPED